MSLDQQYSTNIFDDPNNVDAAIADEDVRKLLKDIRDSEKFIEKMEPEWNRYLRYFKNDFFDYRSNDDRITVNYIYAVVKSAIPQLYYKNPYITVNPRKVRSATDEDVQANTQKILQRIAPDVFPSEVLSPEKRALVLESILNWLFDELKIKGEIKKVILDAKVFGLGYMKVGYTFKSELVSKKKEDGTLDYEEHIKEDQIHVYRLSPKQVIMPIGFDAIEKMPWLTIKYLKPLDDVKNSKDYENASKVTGEKIDKTDFYSKKRTKSSELSQELFATLYEVWDKRNNRVITISGNGIKLKEKKWPYYMDGFPVERLSFNDIPDEYFPISEVKYLEPQNLELNRYRTRQLKHNLRFNRKYIYDKSSIDPSEVKKLERGDDGIIVGANKDPSTAVLPISDAPLSSDNRYFQEDIRQDMRIMSGFDDLQLGAGVRSAQTATEASIAEQAKRLRVDVDADVVQDFVSSIARKIVQLILQLYDKKMVLNITGMSDISWTPIVDKKTIQGEYDVKVESGSSLPLTEEIRRRTMIDLLNLLGAPIFAKELKIPGLLRSVLKTYSNIIKNPEEIMAGEQTNREAEIAASTENQLLFMGRDVNAMPEQAHTVHIKRHVAFMDSQPAGTFDDMVSQNFWSHIQEHLAFIQQTNLQETRGGSPMGGSMPDQSAGPTGVVPNMEQGPMQNPEDVSPLNQAMSVESGNASV